MEYPRIGVWAVEVRAPRKPHVERVSYACTADGVVPIAAATYSAHGVWVATSGRGGSVTALPPVPPGEASASGSRCRPPSRSPLTAGRSR